MKISRKNPRTVEYYLLLMLSLLFSACSSPEPAAVLPSPTYTASPATTNTPQPVTSLVPTPSLLAASPTSALPTTSLTATPAISVPKITLNKGDYFFTVNGRQSLIFVRNMGGYETEQYFQLLDLMKGKGTQVVRIQLDSLGMGYDRTGLLDPVWAKKWERIMAYAAQNGIAVLPVFTGWFDWNDGDPDYNYSMWKSNPLRSDNNGPAAKPGELFKDGSPTQTAWLSWLKTLVERWQGQENIFAWEIFSEVNLASGVTEPSGIAFIEKAAQIIHAADPRQRPITASLAETGGWSKFYNSETIDFINSHPYPPSGQLDREILKTVRFYLDKYHKPVFIGESGLSAVAPAENTNTLTTATKARIGIQHAIWAGLVSGAMDGRALYWEDGFAVYFPRLSWLFLLQYMDAESVASQFIKDVDFSGFQPLEVRFSGAIFGAAVGNESTILGWFRDAACEPPDWLLKPLISGQTVSLQAPGAASTWQVEFYDAATGDPFPETITIHPEGNTLTIPLPDFTDALAFKLEAQ